VLPFSLLPCREFIGTSSLLFLLDRLAWLPVTAQALGCGHRLSNKGRRHGERISLNAGWTLAGSV